VKETAKHLQITLNVVVLAIAAGALRELLLRYDGRADRPLVASILATVRSGSQLVKSSLPMSSVVIAFQVAVSAADIDPKS
jgi:diacylglycerol O-acyltransferase / wax synthase